MALNINDLMALKNNEFIKGLSTENLVEINQGELDKIIDELGFNSKEFSYLSLEKDNTNLLHNVLTKSFGEDVQIPTLINLNEDNSYAIGFIGKKSKTSRAEASIDSYATFIMELSIEETEELKQAKVNVDEAEFMKNMSLMDFARFDEDNKSLSNYGTFKDDFISFLQAKEFDKYNFGNSKLKRIDQAIDLLQLENFELNKLDIQEIEELSVLFNYFADKTLGESRGIEEELSSALLRATTTRAKVKDVFNPDIGSITKNIYQSNGNLNAQGFIKDAGEGMRNERLVKNSTFDLKRQINTFFKKGNDSVNELLDSYREKILSNKLGKSIYAFNSKIAAKNNVPIYQNIQKAISTSFTATKYNVGKDRDLFGSTLGVSRFLDKSVIDRANADIVEEYASNKFYKLFKDYFSPGSAKKIAPDVLDNFVNATFNNTGELISGPKELIRNSEFDRVSNYILQSEDEIMDTFRHFVREEIKKDINPLYNERFVQGASERGIVKDELISKLDNLSDRNQDYFRVLENFKERIKESKSNYISGDAFREALEDSKVGVLDGDDEIGLARKLVTRFEDSFEVALKSNSSFINDLSEVAKNADDPVKETAPLLKRAVNNIFGQFTAPKIAIDFFYETTGANKFTFNDLEVLKMIRQTKKTENGEYAHTRNLMASASDSLDVLNKNNDELTKLAFNEISLLVDYDTSVAIRIEQEIKESGSADLINYDSNVKLDNKEIRKIYNSDDLESIDLKDPKIKKNTKIMANSDLVIIMEDQIVALETAKKAKKNILVVKDGERIFYRNGKKMNSNYNYELGAYKKIGVISGNNMTGASEKFIKEELKNIEFLNNKIYTGNSVNEKDVVDLSYSKGKVLIPELDITGSNFIDEDGNSITDQANGLIKKLKEDDTKTIGEKKQEIITALKDRINTIIDFNVKDGGPEAKAKRVSDIVKFLGGKKLQLNRDLDQGFNVGRLTAIAINQIAKDNGVNIQATKNLKYSSVDKITMDNLSYFNKENEEFADYVKKASDKITYGLENKKGDLKNFILGEDYETSTGTILSAGDSYSYKELRKLGLDNAEYKRFVQQFEDGSSKLENFYGFQKLSGTIEKLNKINPRSEEYKAEIKMISESIEGKEIRDYFKNEYLAYEVENVKNNSMRIMKDIYESASSKQSFDPKLFYDGKIKEMIEDGKVNTAMIYQLKDIKKVSNAAYKKVADHIMNETGIDINTGYKFGFNEETQVDLMKLMKGKGAKDTNDIVEAIEQAVQDNKTIIMDRSQLENLSYKTQEGKINVSVLSKIDKHFREKANLDIFSGLEINTNNIYEATKTYTSVSKIISKALLPGMDATEKNNDIRELKETEISLTAFQGKEGLDKELEAIKRMYKDKPLMQEKVIDELLVDRFFSDPNLRATMETQKFNGRNGSEFTVLNIPVFTNDGQNISELRTKVKLNYGSIAKAVQEGEKAASYQMKTEMIDDIFKIGQMKLMLGTFTDKLNYVQKNFRSTVALDGEKDPIYKMTQKLKSGIISTNIGKNKNNGTIKALKQLLDFNKSALNLKGEFIAFADKIDMSGSNVSYDYNSSELYEAIQKEFGDLDISFTTNESKNITLMKNAILKSELNNKVKDDLLYLLPSNGDVNRELYKNINYYTFNPAPINTLDGMRYLNRSINYSTYRKNYDLIYDTDDSGFTSITSLSQTHANRMLFTKYNNSRFYENMNEFWFNKITIGDFTEPTSLSNKQQPAISGKFWMAFAGLLVDGNGLNAEGQRLFQAEDLRSDVTISGFDGKMTLNQLIAGAINNDAVGVNPLKSSQKQLATDVFNKIQEDYGYNSKFSIDTTYKTMLIGDADDLITTNSISGYKMTFQEGAQYSLSGTATMTSAMNVKQTFSIADLNLDKFSEKVGVEFKSIGQVTEFLADDMNKKYLDLLVDKATLAGKSNEKLLVNILNAVQEEKDIYKKLSYLTLGMKLADLNKEFPELEIESLTDFKRKTDKIFKLDSKAKKEIANIMNVADLRTRVEAGDIDTLYLGTLDILSREFYKAKVDKAGYTQMLNRDMFNVTGEAKSIKRKPGTAFKIDDLRFENGKLILIGSNISGAREGDKNVVDGQKNTISSKNDRMTVEYDGKTIDVAGIVNTKVEKRGQVGTKLYEIVRTAYINIFQADQTNDKSLFKEFVEKTQDYATDIGVSVSYTGGENFEFNTFMDEIIPGQKFTQEGFMEMMNDNKLAQSHFMDKQKEIQKNLIEKYSSKYGDADRADTAYMVELNQAFESFAEENKSQLGDIDRIMIRAANVSVTTSNIQTMLRNGYKGIMDFNSSGVMKQTTMAGLGDYFYLVKSSVSKSMANENKRKEGGLKLNYVMEPLLKLGGYKEYSRAINAQAVSNAKRTLIETLDNMHNEFTTSAIIKKEQSIALAKNQDILFDAFASSLEEAYSEELTANKSYLKSVDDIENILQKKVAIIDTKRVSSSDYLLTEKGSVGNYLSQLRSFETIKLDGDQGVMTVSKNSLEYEMLERIKKNQTFDDMADLINKAKAQGMNPKMIYDTLKNASEVAVFDSEIGRVLVESNIIQRDADRIRGSILIKDERSIKAFESLEKAFSMFDEVTDENKTLYDMKLLLDKVRNFDAETIKYELSNLELDETLYKAKEISNILNKEILREGDPNKIVKLVQTATNFDVVKNMISFIKENKDKEEYVRNIQQFMNNRGLSLKLINLDFALHSDDNDGIVISDSVRELQTYLRASSEYLSNQNSMDEVYSRIRNVQVNDVFSSVTTALKKVSILDNDITEVEFSKYFNELDGMLDYTMRYWGLRNENAIPEKYQKVFEDISKIGSDVYDLQADILRFASGDIRELAKQSNSDPLSIMEETKEQIMRKADEIKIHATEALKVFESFSNDTEFKYVLENAENKENMVSSILGSLTTYTNRGMNNLLSTFTGNSMTDSLSRKGGELFKGMRYTEGKSRVIMPIEGSFLETKFMDMLYDKKTGIMSGHLQALKSLLGESIVENTILKGNSEMINEKNYAFEYIMAQKQKKNLDFFKQFGFSDYRGLTERNIQSVISSMFDENNLLSSVELSGRKSKIARIVEFITLENRMSEIMELGFVDVKTIEKHFDRSVMTGPIYTDFAFLSRHPQQTQFHVSGIKRIIIDFERARLDKQIGASVNPFIAVLTEAMNTENNSGGIALFGKMTAKLKRGDFDGDKNILSELNSIINRNIASLQFSLFNNAPTDLSNYEFFTTENKSMNIKYLFGKSIDEVSHFFEEDVIKRFAEKGINNITQENVKDVVFSIVDMDEEEVKAIKETNDLFKFYMKGRVLDEMPKHRNAYIKFIEVISADKKFGDFIDEQQAKLVNGEITKDEFDNKISEKYFNLTGEDTSTFKKFLGKPAFSEFFSEKTNIGIYNKAVNIKNTGIIFEETAKYRLPGAFAFDYNIEAFIENNEFIKSDDSLKEKLRINFRNFKSNQLNYSKLADLYYDNANEAAISAKHGLSLDALISARSYIQESHMDDKLSEFSKIMGNKYIGLDGMKKEEMLSSLKVFKEAYAISGLKYSFAETAEKTIFNKIGKEFYSGRNLTIGKFPQQTLLLELRKLKRDYGGKVLDEFVNEFVIDKKADAFKNLVEGNTDLSKLGLDSFDDFLKKEKMVSDIEFKGVSRTVEFNMFSGSMETFVNRLKENNSDTDFKIIMKDLSRTLVEMNRSDTERVINEYVSKFDQDLLIDFRKVFKLDDSKYTTKTIQTYFSAIAAFTNVFQQNEFNAEIEIDMIDNVIKRLDSDDLTDNNFMRIFTETTNENKYGFNTRVLNNFKVLGSVIADSSNIKVFKDVYRIKKQDELLKDLIDNSKGFVFYNENQDLFRKKFVEYIKLNISDKIPDQTIQIDYTNLLPKDIELEKEMEYERYFNKMDGIIRSHARRVKEMDVMFLRDSSKALAKMIDFQTATSSNAGVSDPYQFFSDIVKMVREGINPSVVDSPLLKASKATKASMLSLTASTLLKTVTKEGDRLYNNYSNNLKTLNSEAMDKGLTVKTIVEEIFNDGELKRKDVIRIQDELKNVEGINILTRLRDNLGDIFTASQTSAESQLEQFYKEFSFYEDIIYKIENADQENFSVDDYISNIKTNIEKNKTAGMELLEQFDLIEDGKLSIKNIEKRNDEEINKMILKLTEFISDFKIVDTDGVELRAVKQGFIDDVVSSLDDYANDLKLKLPENPKALMRMLARGEISSKTIFYEKLKEVTKNSSNDMKFKYNFMAQMVVGVTGANIPDAESSLAIMKYKLENDDFAIDDLDKALQATMKEFSGIKDFDDEYKHLTSKEILERPDFYRYSNMFSPVISTVSKKMQNPDLEKNISAEDLLKTRKFTEELRSKFIKKNQEALKSKGFELNDEVFKIMSNQVALERIEKAIQNNTDISKELKAFKKDFDNVAVEAISAMNDTKEIEPLLQYFRDQAFKGNLRNIGIGAASIATALMVTGAIRNLFTATETEYISDEEREKIIKEMENSEVNDTIKKNNIEITKF